MSFKKLPSIYSYSDYRSYLKDYFEKRREDSPSYSHRAMAKELGFSSPNYVKLVMDGKRNIGSQSLEKLVAGLKFREKEGAFFSALVFFCQAKKPAEKKYFFGQLMSFKPSVKKGAITPNEYKYYNDWYNCVVRELVVREKPPVMAKNIAEKITPKVTAAQVEKSISLLLDLGLISKNKEGGYQLSSRFIATNREVTSVGIRNYHSKMIELGRDSLDNFGGSEREISSLTLCLSAKGMNIIKKRIQEFQTEILNLTKEDKDSNRVHQLNFQFFPLSEGEGKI